MKNVAYCLSAAIIILALTLVLSPSLNAGGVPKNKDAKRIQSFSYTFPSGVGRINVGVLSDVDDFIITDIVYSAHTGIVDQFIFVVSDGNKYKMGLRGYKATDSTIPLSYHFETGLKVPASMTLALESNHGGDDAITFSGYFVSL